MPRPIRISAVVLALALSAAAPQSANAGLYTVAGCAGWAPYQSSPANLTVFSMCPGFVVRNIGGNFSSPAGAESGWVFAAPPGTNIERVNLIGTLRGFGGWQTTLWSEGGGSPGGVQILQNCPGPSCPGAITTAGDYAVPSAAAVKVRVRCGNSSCPNTALNGAAEIARAEVVLSDALPPRVRIVGGTLVDGNWRAGTHTVIAEVSDNTGIRALRAYVDGSVRSDQPRPACSWGALYPCMNGGGSISVSTSGLSDGPHQLIVEAVDTGLRTQTHATTIYVDNVAPASPLAASVDGGSGWRSSDEFAVRWTDPAQNAAPIIAAAYTFCPAGSKDSSKCTYGVVPRAAGKGATRLHTPGPGLWDARVWLVDSAQNHNAASAVTITNLGFDPTPPTATIAPPEANDPTRVRVIATDEISTIAGGEVEVQRKGENLRHSLPTQVVAEGLTATIDDSVLPDGEYQVRARVVDAAGNERSTSTLGDGAAAAVTLPLRIRTRLAVGKVEKRRARSARSGKVRFQRVLVTKPRPRYGRTVRLNGRLTTPGANALAGVPIDVYELADLPGATWTHVAQVTTSRTGRFMFKALRGPSRLIRFKYGGTATMRPRESTVELAVRGSTSLDVNRHRVVNGEDVVFRGHVRGRPLPPQGKLVELQVYTRGRWRTFAQPRASATSGRWSYRYRFEAVRGVDRFRFRARVRKESGYPFHLGSSSRVNVTVRGV